MNIRILILTVLSVLWISCSQPDFRTLEPDVKNGVIMEARFWRGTFDPSGGFDLRLINNSNANLFNCSLGFDDKYSHSVEGLYSKEKGLIKQKMIAKGDTLTLQFSHDQSNLLYYDIKEQNYFPKRLTLSGDSIRVNWKFKD